MNEKKSDPEQELRQVIDSERRRGRRPVDLAERERQRERRLAMLRAIQEKRWEDVKNCSGRSLRHGFTRIQEGSAEDQGFRPFSADINSLCFCSRFNGDISENFFSTKSLNDCANFSAAADLCAPIPSLYADLTQTRPLVVCLTLWPTAHPLPAAHPEILLLVRQGGFLSRKKPMMPMLHNAGFPPPHCGQRPLRPAGTLPA